MTKELPRTGPVETAPAAQVGLPAPGPCPRCGGPLLDLRGYVFGAPNLEAEGTCFVFNYVTRLPEACRPGDKQVQGETFTCARNLRPHLCYA